MKPPASVVFEVPWQCPRCKQPLPVNGVTESILCGGCQSEVATPPEFWHDVLHSALEYAVTWEEGQTMTMTVMNRWGTLSVFYGRCAVRCHPPCDAPIPPAALGQSLKSGDALPCATCGQELALRAAPESFKNVMDPRIVGLAGERHASDRASSGDDPASVRFHCFGCGAAVPIDGQERAVTCTFCQTALVIPDAIWVRLHPMPTLSRWYVLLQM